MGSSQTRKWVTFQLIFACNSWFHSLHILVSFSFSYLSPIYCIIKCSLFDGNELSYFDLLFVGMSPSRSIFPFGFWFTIHDADCVCSFSFFHSFHQLLQKIFKYDSFIFFNYTHFFSLTSIIFFFIQINFKIINT